MGEVRIDGNYPVIELLEISMDIGVNRHGLLTYGGLISEDSAKQYISQSADRQVVNVSLRSGLEFCGYPQEIAVEHQNDHYYLRVTLVTSSQLMDNDLHDRFFQNCRDSFRDVLTEAYEDSGIGSVVAIHGTEIIRKPILQYRETDWRLTLRMAGRNGAVVIPNVISAEPQVTLGIPSRQIIDENNDIVYFVSRNPDRYRHSFATETRFDGKYEEYGNYYIENQEEYTLFDRLSFQNFLCYEMKSDNRYKLGDSVRVDGKILTVMEKRFTCDREIVEEFYVLGHEQDFAVAFHHNKQITGLELEGTVLGRSGQKVILLLDIDINREDRGKTWFSYSPVTNNGMYSVPLKGEKVMLEWQSEADEDALVVCPMRKNGQETLPPIHRYFLDEHENHMIMIPNKIEYTNHVGNIKWLANNGFDISTCNMVEIAAGQDVKINSQKQVMVFSPERITTHKYRAESSIDMAGAEIHIKAAGAVNEKSKVKDYKKLILPEKSQSYSISASTGQKLAGAIPTF